MSRIIVGVPGAWEDRREIVLAIANGGKFLFGGRIFMEVATGRGCEMEIYEYDPQLETAFRIAAQARVPEEELRSVGEHRHTLYLLSDGASPATARDMMRYVQGLLDCGGLAVKIESSGVAHSKGRWAGFLPSEPWDVMCAFVTLVGGDPFYSCGMHNFALPDCQMSPVLSVTEAAHVMNTFNWYQLAQSPQLRDGHTFSADAGGPGPTFRLSKREDERFAADNPFHNPQGVWQLTFV